jgi:hypothetical protein
VRQAIELRHSLNEASRSLAAKHHGGAQQAAELLLELATSFTGDAPDSRRRLARSRFWARSNATGTALKVMGPTAADALRRQRRGKLGLGPIKPIDVDLVIDSSIAALLDIPASGQPSGAPQALFTSTLDRDLLRSADPIEHVLAGSSRAYARERLDIAARAYRIQSTYPASPG